MGETRSALPTLRSPTQIARQLSSGPKGQKLDRILKDRGYGGDKVGKADLEVPHTT